MGYYFPKSVKEALQILQQEAGKIKVLAGGTDLVVAMKSGKIEPPSILDLSYIEELKYIRENRDSIELGALVTHARASASPLVQRFGAVLAEACSGVGSPQIRARGTLGGNICQASPAGDSIPALMVLEAEVKIASLEKERRVPLEHFFLGPGKTVLAPDELLVEISFPRTEPDEIAFFEKLGQRKALTIAKVSVAFRARRCDHTLRQVRIALGAVAPTVIRARRTEQFLEDNPLGPAVLEEAAMLLMEETKPIDDIRSFAWYRREMAGSLLVRGFSRVAPVIPGVSGFMEKAG